jgi:hypothetical protein
MLSMSTSTGVSPWGGQLAQFLPWGSTYNKPSREESVMESATSVPRGRSERLGPPLWPPIVVAGITAVAVITFLVLDISLFWAFGVAALAGALTVLASELVTDARREGRPRSATSVAEERDKMAEELAERLDKLRLEPLEVDVIERLFADVLEREGFTDAVKKAMERPVFRSVFVTSQLERLADLKEKGALTADDFQAEKRRLLST